MTSQLCECKGHEHSSVYAVPKCRFCDCPSYRPASEPERAVGMRNREVIGIGPTGPGPSAAKGDGDEKSIPIEPTNVGSGDDCVGSGDSGVADVSAAGDEAQGGVQRCLCGHQKVNHGSSRYNPYRDNHCVLTSCGCPEFRPEPSPDEPPQPASPAGREPQGVNRFTDEWRSSSHDALGHLDPDCTRKIGVLYRKRTDDIEATKYKRCPSCWPAPNLHQPTEAMRAGTHYCGWRSAWEYRERTAAPPPDACAHLGDLAMLRAISAKLLDDHPGTTELVNELGGVMQHIEECEGQPYRAPAAAGTPPYKSKWHDRAVELANNILKDEARYPESDVFEEADDSWQLAAIISHADISELRWRLRARFTEKQEPAAADTGGE